MILPTKHLRSESSLIYVGGIIKKMIASKAMSVDQLWHSTKKEYNSYSHGCDITYDWFVLSLSMLYEIDSIALVDGRIVEVCHD